MSSWEKVGKRRDHSSDKPLVSPISAEDADRISVARASVSSESPPGSSRRRRNRKPPTSRGNIDATPHRPNAVDPHKYSTSGQPVSAPRIGRLSTFGNHIPEPEISPPSSPTPAPSNTRPKTPRKTPDAAYLNSKPQPPLPNAPRRPVIEAQRAQVSPEMIWDSMANKKTYYAYDGEVQRLCKAEEQRKGDRAGINQDKGNNVERMETLLQQLKTASRAELSSPEALHQRQKHEAQLLDGMKNLVLNFKEVHKVENRIDREHGKAMKTYNSRCKRLNQKTKGELWRLATTNDKGKARER